MKAVLNGQSRIFLIRLEITITIFHFLGNVYSNLPRETQNIKFTYHKLIKVPIHGDQTKFDTDAGLRIGRSFDDPHARGKRKGKRVPSPFRLFSLIRANV